ncbi:MAG: hypothetical protein ACRD9W_02175 [Terriglobia bacterium]
MRLPTAFDPIEIGEIDNFAFDFTADIGAATLVSSAWTCALAPYQTGMDPSPQSRIIATEIATAIQTRDPLSGALQTRAGSFSIASVGGMPASALGATYVLEATVTLNDGRILSLNSTVLCTGP